MTLILVVATLPRIFLSSTDVSCSMVTIGENRAASTFDLGRVAFLICYHGRGAGTVFDTGGTADVLLADTSEIAPRGTVRDVTTLSYPFEDGSAALRIETDIRFTLLVGRARSES